jgi:hypothetical protein
MGDSASLQFTLLCVWLMCLLVATFLGYERGRWFTGLWLGLFFGPFGVIAAGFLLPDPAVEGRRKHEIDRVVAGLRRQDQEAARERRQSHDDLDNFLSAVESQVAVAKSADDSTVAMRAPSSANGGEPAGGKRPSDRRIAVSKLAEQLASTPTPALNGMLCGPKEPRADFSVRLKELARDLEGLAQIDAIHADDLRRWVRWLNTKSDAAAAMKRRARSRMP